MSTLLFGGPILELVRHSSSVILPKCEHCSWLDAVPDGKGRDEVIHRAVGEMQVPLAIADDVGKVDRLDTTDTRAQTRHDVLVRHGSEVVTQEASRSIGRDKVPCAVRKGRERTLAGENVVRCTPLTVADRWLMGNEESAIKGRFDVTEPRQRPRNVDVGVVVDFGDEIEREQSTEPVRSHDLHRQARVRSTVRLVDVENRDIALV